MLINAISQFKALKAPAGKYADGQGLWLWKRTKDGGSWVLRYSVAGNRREMGLGRWPDVGIAEARDRAAAARRLLRDGLDPLEARRRREEVEDKPVVVFTLKEAVAGAWEARKASLKDEGTAGRWMSPLESHVLPKLGKRAVETIDQHALVEVLGPLWHEKAETAKKAMRRVGLALKHAAALGHEVDLQAVMKAKALLGAQRVETVHIPSMPYRDAPAFYRSLLGVDMVAARALRLLILTVARTTEVRLATRDEFDGATWNLPAVRTKTNEARRIPLVGEAMRVLDECGSPALFPSVMGKQISDAAMAAYMKREGLSYRPHGFRATFRTWCEEQTDAAFEVKEAVLGHTVDRGVVGAYQRSDRFDKRKALLESWEAFLLGH